MLLINPDKRQNYRIDLPGESVYRSISMGRTVVAIAEDEYGDEKKEKEIPRVFVVGIPAIDNR